MSSEEPAPDASCQRTSPGLRSDDHSPNDRHAVGQGDAVGRPEDTGADSLEVPTSAGDEMTSGDTRHGTGPAEEGSARGVNGAGDVTLKEERSADGAAGSSAGGGGDVTLTEESSGDGASASEVAGAASEGEVTEVDESGADGAPASEAAASAGEGEVTLVEEGSGGLTPAAADSPFRIKVIPTALLQPTPEKRAASPPTRRSRRAAADRASSHIKDLLNGESRRNADDLDSAGEKAPPPARAWVPASTTAGGIAGNTVTASAGSGTLVTNRISACIMCQKVRQAKYMMVANGTQTLGSILCSDTCMEGFVASLKAGRINMAGQAVQAASAWSPSGGSPPVQTGPAASAASPETPEAAVMPVVGRATRGTFCHNATCRRAILRKNTLRTVWETNVYCSPSCAIQHQKRDGTRCVFCKKSLPEMILGKFCVRFGSDVRQFCSNSCLDSFKKRLKVCTYCQRDITRSQGSFLAPIGPGRSNQFKEFCSQTCLTHCRMNQAESVAQAPLWHRCAVCLKDRPVQHRVAISPHESIKHLCSAICLKAYTYKANKEDGELEECAMCKALVLVERMAQFRIWHGSAHAQLCSQSCCNAYVLARRRIVSCRFCRVKKYNFDMMEVTSETDGMYCSVQCLSNFGKRAVAPPHAQPMSKCGQCWKTMSGCTSPWSTPDHHSLTFCSQECAVTFMKEKAAGQRVAAPAAAPMNGTAEADPARQQQQHPQQQQPALARPGAQPSPPEASLPQILSVVSLAPSEAGSGGGGPAGGGGGGGGSGRDGGDDGLADGGAARLRPGACDLPGLVLLPPEPVRCRNVSVQVQPRPGQVEDVSVQVQPRPGETKDVSVQGRSRPEPAENMTPSGDVALTDVIPTAPRLRIREDEACGEDSVAVGVSRTLAQRGSEEPSAPVADSVSDGKTRYVPIPIPVPFYVPVPMAMYNCPYPVPVPFVLPVPVPLVLPAPAAACAPLPQHGPAPARQDCRSPSPLSELQAVLGLTRDGSARPADTDSPADGGGGGDSRSTSGPGGDPPSAGNSDAGRAPEPGGDPTGAEPAAADADDGSAEDDGQPPRKRRKGAESGVAGNGQRDSPAPCAACRRLQTEIDERLRVAVLGPAADKLVSRMSEQDLWEAKVLGAHVPETLLATVVYMVATHFSLSTPEMLEKLSFSVMEGSLTRWAARKKSSEDAGLTLLDSENIYGRKETFEMPENIKDPLKCPVRFIEFYISKCPDEVRGRPDVALWLEPAPGRRPHAAAWFSPSPLGRAALRFLLSRLRVARPEDEPS